MTCGDLLQARTTWDKDRVIPQRNAIPYTCWYGIVALGTLSQSGRRTNTEMCSYSSHAHTQLSCVTSRTQAGTGRGTWQETTGSSDL